MNKPDMERLAVAQALNNALKDMLDTRKPWSLRAAADDELRERYITDGVDRVRLMVNGEPVGTLSARLSKEVDEVACEVEDAEAFVKWLRTSDGGLDTLRRIVYAMPSKVVEQATKDGELPDGCAMRKRHVPVQWLGATLRVDKQKVAKALGPALPQAVAGLLGGEVE